MIGKITLDDTEYKKKIEELKQKNKEIPEEFDKKHKAKMIAGWTAVAVAVIAVIKQVANLAKSTMDYADQVGDLAEKWGFTTKQIQEFDYWASQNGTTLESLMTGMRGLVNQAQAGSSAFKELGINVRNTDGTLKNQRELFLETITALQQVENQTERNALQFDIFGRSGVELGQIINKTGAELEALSQKAEDYGIIISEEAIKASSDFNDELDTIKKQFKSSIAELVAGNPEEAFKKFEAFATNLINKMGEVIPKFIVFFIRVSDEIMLQLIKQLPTFISSLLQEILNFDWFSFGWDLAKEIFVGLAEGLWNLLQTLVGKGWLWGKENPSTQIETLTSSTANSTITNAVVSEKTTKVNETLDITLSVESDGTLAGDKNLDTVSDILVEKINKALGDMVNG